ncbi:MAG: SIR2 family NAD-dependent protein deacylase [Salibacteraceae bacterium]
MKKVVVFSGAGISAESGISTFRDSNGLWEKNKIEEVATPEAFSINPKLVLDFYNERRRQIAQVKPNNAHTSLAELEPFFDVHIITQNIDDLHERGGSNNVLHLHGKITEAKGHVGNEIIQIGYNDLELGGSDSKGRQLRPNIVWFGEDVPNYSIGIEIIQQADIFIVIGTSLNVHPAAGMIHYAPLNCKKFAIDPKLDENQLGNNFTLINEPAAEALPKLVRQLINARQLDLE